MKLKESYRTSFQWARELLALVMADTSSEVIHWQPPGRANPVAATYAHALCSTDAIVHTLFQGRPPLYEEVWLSQTGISAPQWGSDPEWAHTVQVDPDTARAYGEAVFDAVDAFLASLEPEDAERMIDLSAFHLGSRSLDWCLNALMIGHLHNLIGDISALIGMQGGRGFPF